MNTNRKMKVYFIYSLALITLGATGGATGGATSFSATFAEDTKQAQQDCSKKSPQKPSSPTSSEPSSSGATSGAENGVAESTPESCISPVGSISPDNTPPPPQSPAQNTAKTPAEINEDTVPNSTIATETGATDNGASDNGATPGFYTFFITGKTGPTPVAILPIAKRSTNQNPIQLKLIAMAAGPTLRTDGLMTGMYFSYECVKYTLKMNGVTFQTELMTPFPGNPYCPKAPTQIDLDLKAIGVSHISGITVEIMDAQTNTTCRKLPIYNYHLGFDGTGARSKSDFETRFCPVGEVDGASQVGVGLLVQ